MPRYFTVLLILVAMLVAVPARAMDFSLLKQGKVRMVLAQGPIERGDAARLAAALDLATRDKSGTKVLLLNSPGGLVDESFAMATVMDQVGVRTVVPNEALCASACASVLFVSGKYRTIEKGGALAIHSCFDARNGRAMSDCNALISAHAAYEGVSGGAMMAFQQVAGSHSALLFDTASAACFGLTLKPGSHARHAAAPCLDAAMKAGRRK